MREKVSGSVGVGLISILTILLVLVLAIFSCLTLSTAQGDYSLAKLGANTVSSYYKADSQAQTIYAAFREGQEQELETVVAIDGLQGIRISLERQAGGSVLVRAWQRVTLQDFSAYADRKLPVMTE